MTMLDTIVEEKRREIARLPQRRLLVSDLQQAIRDRADRRDFLQALRRRGPVRFH